MNESPITSDLQVYNRRQETFRIERAALEPKSCRSQAAFRRRPRPVVIVLPMITSVWVDLLSVNLCQACVLSFRVYETPALTYI